MSMVQGRTPIASDFEDISLFDPRDIKSWKSHQESRGSREYANSELSFSDPHASLQSHSSTVSTPTLISDTSSLRSSLGSNSSPSLTTAAFAPHGPPVVAAPSLPPIPFRNFETPEHHSNTSQSSLSTQSSGSTSNTSQAQHSNKGRRRSVPSHFDNTSMASLTIKAQASSRSRKQRELDFEADQDDEIWPGDSLMFNVPMSPALYAQQRYKQHHIPSSLSSHSLLPPPKNNHPNSKPASYQRPEGSLNGSVHQQLPMPPRRSAANYPRQSLPSINEGNRAHRTPLGSRDSIRSVEDQLPRPGSLDRASSRSSISSLPSLLSRRGSCSLDCNTSIDGLDPDASVLTLELYRLEEKQESQRISRCSTENAGDISIASLSLADDGTPLPSPVLGSDRTSGDCGDRDSRRSSLTRPENLPPKSEEEDRKHMKEYEMLLKNAVAAEKRKQKKQEEAGRMRATQLKQDRALWETWLAKNGKVKLSSDLKWRGMPEQLRGAIWSMLGTDKSLDTKALPAPKRSFRRAIEIDSESVWPECCIFGKHRPLHEPLIDTIERFLSLRPELPYSFSLTGIAAVLLLYLNDVESVATMVNIIKPGSLVHAILSGNERIASANYVSFSKIFRKKFVRLSEHFDKVGLDDTSILNPMISGLFTTILPSPEATARTLDVFFFDGDSFLLRAALGILRINEAYLYGSKETILEQLRNSRPVPDDELMKQIRDITKH